MTDDDIVVQTREKLIFIGADGKEFATEQEALVSLIEEKIYNMLLGAAAYGQIEHEAAVDVIVENRHKLKRWLEMLE